MPSRELTRFPPSFPGKPLPRFKTAPITLPYTDNMISFDFAALDYTSPAKNQCAYMLEGLEKEWVHSGTRHYASYTNLQPGKYVFRAKGSSRAGVWNEAGLSLRIVIAPPFWKT